MSSKEGYKGDYSYRSEGKFAEGKDNDSDDKEYFDNYDKPTPPTVNITAIRINPIKAELTAALRLDITFELDRDAVAAYWEVKFLVDCTHARVIKILGQTDVEDYPDGESDMSFSVDGIDVSGIAPSTLANSGLLMAVLMADGEEVASVNMVSLQQQSCSSNLLQTRSLLTITSATAGAIVVRQMRVVHCVVPSLRAILRD
jgi:hypothetical protein